MAVAFSPQAGAALFQCQRTVLPGAGPVLFPAAPVPGVPQWHPAAGRRAGLYGPLPAGCRVSHVHRRIPHHLQEPAAVSPPEVSSRVWHALLVAGRPQTVPGSPDPSSLTRGRGLLQGKSSRRQSLVSILGV